MEQVQDDLYNKAVKERDEHIKEVDTWDQFMEALNQKNLCMTPWCEESACEVNAKNKSKEESLKAMETAGEDEELLTGAAKTLCIPFE